jgi:selenocysteine lyase/cysteine desulfurase
MMIRALEQLLEWKPESVQRYCKNLTADLVKELCRIGYLIEDDGRRAHHLFGIRLPGHIERATLQQRLAERNIHVSVRGSAIRISPHVYNHEGNINALQDVLEQAI